MNECIHHDNQLGQFFGVCFESYKVYLRRATLDCCVHVIWKVLTINDGVFLDEARFCLSNVSYWPFRCVHHLVVFCYLFLFKLIDLLHSSLQKTLYESRHIMNWAINEEFF
jgi:hypothetical protein